MLTTAIFIGNIFDVYLIKEFNITPNLGSEKREIIVKKRKWGGIRVVLIKDWF